MNSISLLFYQYVVWQFLSYKLSVKYFRMIGVQRSENNPFIITLFLKYPYNPSRHMYFRLLLSAVIQIVQWPKFHSF